MTLRNRVALRDQANFLFAKVRKIPVSRNDLSALFQAAVHKGDGIAVFESWHGTYSYPLLMAEMMPVLAKQNVKRFYTEMIPSDKQDLVDRWQQDGDEQGLIDYFDSRHVGFSRRMWQHYWIMLKAADAHGIKVVGIDIPEQLLKRGKRQYDAVFLAPFKNMYFEGIIEEEQENAKPGEKFVLYAGESHGTDFGGALRSIHDRLGVPRLILNEGEYAVSRHIFSNLPSFSVSIPLTENQDPRVKGHEKVRTLPIRYPA